MKLSVGDYVRTDYGLIGKIFEKYRGVQNATIYKVDVSNEDFDYTNVFKFEVVKSSPNIIDLIEVGDYVDGMKVIDIVENDVYISDYYAESYIGIVKVKDIKSVVTKEQFEQMEYKVED